MKAIFLVLIFCLSQAFNKAPIGKLMNKKIKASILEQIATELETKKDLKWDIYNIGCAKKA